MTNSADRYSRQRLLPQIGEQGQALIAASRSVVVGCGALGTVQATLLVRAGTGETILIDRDIVEVSNLQRQSLFDERDAEEGVPKAVAAARCLQRANSEVSVVAVVKDLTPSNAEHLLKGADVVLDGTDNYETRYLLNDVAVKYSIPWIYGAAVGTRGSVMPIVPGRTACLACMFPSAPAVAQPTCDTAGVLNAVTSMVASLQAAEALKILAGRPNDVCKRLVSSDVWTGERSSVRADVADPGCTTCALRHFQHLSARTRRPAMLCGRNAVQLAATDRPVDLAALARSLAGLGEVKESEHLVRFRCPPHELTVFPDGRAIVKGTQDLGQARSLCTRYVGP